jgi:DNA-binding HxlR family transcriptional regulator
LFAHGVRPSPPNQVIGIVDDDNVIFLRRLMPDISHKVLAATLRNLEREGLICRTEFPEVPPRVEYRISPYGESVRPLIEAVRLWGRAHLGRKP